MGLTLACLGLNSSVCTYLHFGLDCMVLNSIAAWRNGFDVNSLCIKTGVCTVRALACSSHIDIFFVTTV